MASSDVELVTGRLRRGDSDLETRLEVQIRDGRNVTFEFPKGTIVTGEMLHFLSVDRTIEFVVNSETPSESSAGVATYDGRILKTAALSPDSKAHNDASPGSPS